MFFQESQLAKQCRGLAATTYQKMSVVARPLLCVLLEVLANIVFVNEKRCVLLEVLANIVCFFNENGVFCSKSLLIMSFLMKTVCFSRSL